MIIPYKLVILFLCWGVLLKNKCVSKAKDIIKSGGLRSSVVPQCSKSSSMFHNKLDFLRSFRYRIVLVQCKSIITWPILLEYGKKNCKILPCTGLNLFYIIHKRLGVLSVTLSNMIYHISTK